MASTRNNNEKHEYALEKRQNKLHSEYLLSPVFSEQPNTVRMMDLGTGPSKMYMANMSHNAIDIESKLRGIRSCNLEGSNFNPSLQKKSFNSLPLFENHLRENVYLPSPLIHYSNERSGFHNM